MGRAPRLRGRDSRPERRRRSRDQGRGARDPRAIRVWVPAPGSGRAPPGAHLALRCATPAATRASRRCSCIRSSNDEINIEIRDDDLKIDVYRASGAGGQHVNKTSSAVRITHIPSGIVVASQQERSQFKNKATAMKMLKNRLYQLEADRQARSKAELDATKADVTFGSQIRSYVFQPYTMVNDHRTELKIPDVQKVMDGDDRSVHRGVSQAPAEPARQRDGRRVSAVTPRRQPERGSQLRPPRPPRQARRARRARRRSRSPTPSPARTRGRGARSAARSDAERRRTGRARRRARGRRVARRTARRRSRISPTRAAASSSTSRQDDLGAAYACSLSSTSGTSSASTARSFGRGRASRPSASRRSSCSPSRSGRCRSARKRWSTAASCGTAEFADPEQRYRQRYADLAVHPEVRAVFVARARMVSAIRRFPRRPRVSRSRDAGAAAAVRRRDRAAVHDAPLRARHAAVSAHRGRAVPQAADRRGASSACMRSGTTSGTKGSTGRTIPSSRCSSSTRRTRTTTTMMGVVEVAGRGRGRRRAVRDGVAAMPMRRRADVHAALSAPRVAARRSSARLGVDPCWR